MKDFCYSLAAGYDCMPLCLSILLSAYLLAGDTMCDMCTNGLDLRTIDIVHRLIYLFLLPFFSFRYWILDWQSLLLKRLVKNTRIGGYATARGFLRV